MLILLNKQILAMKKLSYAIFLLFFLSVQLKGQVFTNKEVGKKYKATLADTIKKVPEYPYLLPIWGAKVAAKGFSLPYSAGLSVNYLWQQSDLVIENIMVGFNSGPMYDLSNVIRTEKAVSMANGLNLRPDFWIFPFLNVYGILAKARTSTEVGMGLWVPDGQNNWQKVTSFTSKANFEATSVGIGATPTIGIGGGFLALDLNYTWTDVSALDKPVKTFIFGPRLGKNFKLKKPEKTVAFWVGAFRLHLSSSTAGSLALSEVLPTDQLQAKIDQGIQKVGEADTKVETWWAGLTPVEQKNPVNIAKYNGANLAIDKASEILAAADAAVGSGSSATVEYSLEKRPKDMWNFIVGSQFQFNKHWMIRGEYGFLGSRQQFIGGLQYRFGL
jgi:hypothetical protein